MSRSSSYIPGSRRCLPEAGAGQGTPAEPGDLARVEVGTWMLSQGKQVRGCLSLGSLGPPPLPDRLSGDHGAGEEGRQAFALPSTTPVSPSPPLGGVLPTSSACQEPRNQELASLKLHSKEGAHSTITRGRA